VAPPARTIKALLHGTWLGHALHPVISTAASGAQRVGLLLDLGGAPHAGDQGLTMAGISLVRVTTSELVSRRSEG